MRCKEAKDFNLKTITLNFKKKKKYTNTQVCGLFLKEKDTENFKVKRIEKHMPSKHQES